MRPGHYADSDRRAKRVSPRESRGPTSASATASTLSCSPHERAPNQFRLLGQRRFLPFFGAAGARRVQRQRLSQRPRHPHRSGGTISTSMQPEVLTNLAGGLFILPYLLFSGLAGQLADRFDKSRVVQAVKATRDPDHGARGHRASPRAICTILMAALFMLGMHSTFFAPAQIRPAAADPQPNGADRRQRDARDGHVPRASCSARWRAACSRRATAPARSSARSSPSRGVGLVLSLIMPRGAGGDPGAAHRLESVALVDGVDPRGARIPRGVPVRAGQLVVLVLRRARARAVAALREDGARRVGRSRHRVPVRLLAGVGIGSLLCEKLSGGKVEIGLVPFGSIGLTVFALDLALASPTSGAAHEVLSCARVPPPAGLLAHPARTSPSSASSAASSSCRSMRSSSSARGPKSCRA